MTPQGAVGSNPTAGAITHVEQSEGGRNCTDGIGSAWAKPRRNPTAGAIEYSKRGLIDIKQGKKPTAQQKKYMSDKLGLDPKDWQVLSWDNSEARIQRKSDGLIKTIQFE